MIPFISKETVRFLKQIVQNRAAYNRSQGLCYNLELRCYDYDNNVVKMRRWIQRWEQFSGDSLYPVPHPEGASKAYNRLPLWDNDEYGDLRRQLCLYIANKIEKEYAQKYRESHRKSNQQGSIQTIL